MKQLLAIDPGRDKSGLALLAKATGRATVHETIANAGRRAAIRMLLAGADIETVAVGNGTGSREAAEEARAMIDELPMEQRPELLIVDERHSTYRARFLYLEENPPRFPWSLLPRKLVPVTAPLDGYAAWAIGLAWLATEKQGRIPFNKNLW